MMTAVSAPDFQKRFSYHHGNLREALLAAALDLLAQDGVENLSLRTLARVTGVTQAAPYSHFRDKDELLAAIAETGFQRLALRMASDAAGAMPVRAKIEKLMQAYIAFACENKALFGIMFGREVSDLRKYPTLAMTAGKGYALISAALSRRAPSDEDTAFLTVAVWSLCQGLTTLIVNNRIDPAHFGARDLAEFIRRTAGIFSNHLQDAA